MEWSTALISLANAIVGGLVGAVLGGWIVAYRIGAWRATIEAKLAEHEERLDDGKDRVREVPLIRAQVEAGGRSLAPLPPGHRVARYPQLLGELALRQAGGPAHVGQVGRI